MQKSKLKKTLDAAEDHCRSRGTRLTPKRKLVLSALLNSSEAMTAYELIDTCEDVADEKLPAMTIYRILDFLEEEGLVHKLKLANRYVACVHIVCDHAHATSQFLICGQCYRVEERDIARSTLGDLRNDVESSGFSLAGGQLEIDCLCESCATA